MILVTGGTGMFGSRIVSELTARQVPVRVMARDLARARSVLGPDVELIQADMDRPASLPEALRGVDRVFLVSPMDQRLADREIAVIDAAVQARVDWVVKVHGAVRHQQDPADPLVQLHQAPIDRLRQSGLKWALLSPQTVME
ncbi:MAG: NAD(P)H-binding protein, partial [Chloroflexi bacterium]|nr:NAD(P)H-binding protein [Chloroflexota bacterium]